jgi:NAD(P)-dependent dehydrogenase (short-subunit alcohol dehydrogenase family)
MNAGFLSGSVAWISGGASGMGEAAVRLFAREGARVAFTDVQTDRGRQIEQEVLDQDGKALFISCDVSNENQVRESLERTAGAFGAPSILVNCAGIVHVKLLHEYSEAEWDQLMGVNVKSIFFSIKHGLRYLREHRRSYMVNIGSIGSFIGQGMTPAYTTSKGAVLQLTRSIALDYAVIGLRANCVCPGITDTPMLRHHLNTTPDPAATLAARLRRVPMGVALSPADIAKSLLYFSCEQSAGITGTSLVVDGGYLAAAEWTTEGRTAFMEPS